MVSVIIPTYNRERLIERSIRSVLNQTYSDIELIVVDDCSSDNTKQVVESIKDNRLHYYRLNKNLGACAARNYGIAHSHGEWIAFQDSDDVWHTDKIEKQIDYMVSKGALVSFCNMNIFEPNSDLLMTFPKNLDKEFISFDDLLPKSLISTQCLIAEKNCFSDIKFDEKMPRLQDWDLTLQLSKRYPILHINETLVDMYRQTDSIGSDPVKGINALELLYDKWSEELQSNSTALHNWNKYYGDYLLRAHNNPAFAYRRALNIKFDKKLFVKYLLAKMNLLIPIYVRMGII